MLVLSVLLWEALWADSKTSLPLPSARLPPWVLSLLARLIPRKLRKFTWDAFSKEVWDKPLPDKWPSDVRWVLTLLLPLSTRFAPVE